MYVWQNKHHSRHMLGWCESFFFAITCESVGTVDSMCFPWQQQSEQGWWRPEATWVCFFVVLRARCS